jgi:glycosyltransferase involved in cell wall biosynthesis
LKIHQFHAVLSQASAVSNEVLALHEWFEFKGYRSQVFSEYKGTLAGVRVDRWDASIAAQCDLLLVHYSRGSDLHDSVFDAPCRNAMIYHDVTPPRFFADTDRTLRECAELGLSSLPRYATRPGAAVAHSKFSAEVLRDCGYSNVQVLPYVLNERLYTLPPKLQTLGSRYEQPRILLAVGRVAPNKCLEDCLFVADYLNRVLGLGWRLLIVGSAQGTEVYLRKLEQLRDKLNLRNVEFTGEVSQERLLAYYRVADALILMSEHEGFGVPLVEAMRFDVPVFAYAAGATPEVLGEGGVLFEHKDWAVMAEAIARVAREPALREGILAAQRLRWAELSPAAVLPKWQQWIEGLVPPPLLPEE